MQKKIRSLCRVYILNIYAKYAPGTLLMVGCRGRGSFHFFESAARFKFQVDRVVLNIY